MTRTGTKAKPTARGRKITAFLGHIVSPKSATSYIDIQNGALLVDGNGKIVAIGQWSKLKSSYGNATVVDYKDKLITPGFVDLHIHLPQIPQTGRSGKTLLGWLDSYVFPEEERFCDEKHAQKIANWFFNELARNGTTLAAVFTTVHERACDIAFQIAADKGHRVIMGKVLMDSNSPKALTEDAAISLWQAEELCQKWHGYDDNRLLYAFIPRFALSSSSPLLNGCSKLWKKYKGTYLHTHLAETKDECALVKKKFPKHKNYVDVYAQHNLVGKNSIFAHAIHLDDAELAVLKAANCAIAHCPSSNFFLKSGFFPFARVKKAGIKFGLGSDVAAGPQMTLFTIMKEAAYMQMNEWISPRELFYLATLGGAKAVNLEKNVGSLEVGKEADFIVIDPTRKTGVPNDMLEQTTDDILSTLIYLGDDRMIVSTFVRGRKLYQAEGPLEDKVSSVNRRQASRRLRLA